MSPIIGITVEATHDPEDPRSRGRMVLNWNYAEAIARAGGVPILIPPMADMKAVASLIDGLLIPGGYDIDAKRFDEENHPKVELQDPSRYDAEARLFAQLDAEVPVLGICYGCQFINVIRGGSLVQHLPDVVNHESHSGGTVQEYAIAESKLQEILGTSKAQGKSYHHQAVGRVGEGLRVVGTAGDGTIEAIEATDHPWMIGVQWHPERMFEEPETIRLFERFIEAAEAYSKTRRMAVAR